jgi:hypothetical protein
MDARGLLLEIADRTRRQLAETDGAKTTIFFQATEPAAAWSLRWWGESPVVPSIVEPAVLELGEIVIGAFDHLPPHIRGAVRPYRHDPAATWSRVVGILVAAQGRVFGSPDPFCGRREFLFTRVEAVTVDAAERLAALLKTTPAGPSGPDDGTVGPAGWRAPPRRGKARESVNVDALLLRLVKSVSKKCRDEDLESFLDREVRSKGSEDLSEMLQEHLGEDVSPQTIRRKVDGKGSPHASKLYAEWSRPPAHPGDARDVDDDVQRNSAPMSDRDAQVDEMRRSGSVTKRIRRRS